MGLTAFFIDFWGIPPSPLRLAQNLKCCPWMGAYRLSSKHASQILVDIMSLFHQRILLQCFKCMARNLMLKFISLLAEGFRRINFCKPAKNELIPYLGRVRSWNLMLLTIYINLANYDEVKTRLCWVCFVVVVVNVVVVVLIVVAVQLVS